MSASLNLIAIDRQKRRVKLATKIFEALYLNFFDTIRISLIENKFKRR